MPPVTDNATPRVMIVLSGEYPGGSAATNRMQKFARGLRAAGADVFLLAAVKEADKQPGPDWSPDDHGLPFAQAPIPRSRLRIPYRILKYTALPGIYGRKFEQFVQRERLDAVILYGSMGFPYRNIVRICRERGITCLVQLDEDHKFRPRFLTQPHFWDQELYRPRLMRKIDGIIGISRFWEEYASERGLPSLRVPAIGDVEPTAESLAERKPHDGFILTFLGLIAPRDMPATMLGGIRLAAQRGLDIRVVFVGRVEKLGTGRNVIREVQDDPILKDRVTFTGFVSYEEVRQRLAETDALVLIRPDTREVDACFPTRLPEYLLTGNPVILSTAGDMPLYFEHRKNAWLMTNGDSPEQLADALIALSENPDEARAIGQAGRETAIREFSYLVHGRRLLDFIIDLRKKAGTPAAGEARKA